MTQYKAPFITFEGGEGSGKSTQIELLFRNLQAKGVDAVSYREPGGTKGAEDIRTLLLRGEGERWTPTTEALLMSAARADLVYKQILPHLEKGIWVLCDRFTDSTLAYQGFGYGLGYDKIQDLNFFTVGSLKPDLTFIFQIDPELGLSRAASREKGVDRFEKLGLDFHRRVTEGYMEVLKNHPDRCISVNALLDINVIADMIFEEVIQRFKL